MSTVVTDEPHCDSGTPRSAALPWLLVTGVVLAAFNLRTAVTSVGALLDEVRDGLGMPSAVAGLLTTLPVLCFAVLGGLTPMAVRRFGPRAVMTAALTIMSLGLVVRASVDHAAVFLIASALALTGGAVGNVTVPSVVKQHFGDRVGAMTTAYSTALAVGTMAAALLTVPLEGLMDGHWQPALGIWALPALLAILPWLAWRDRASDPSLQAGPARLRGLWRTRMAWMMALFFGAQSMLAYILMGWLAQMMRDHGYSAAEAGFMLGMFTAVSIPVSLTVPAIAARAPDQRPVMYALLAMYPVGLGGLWLGSAGWSMWLWIVAAGIAVGTFPLILTLFVLRARSTAGTAALSAFGQSIGYLIAGLGPLLVGVLYGATDGWTAPFLLMFGTVATQFAVGGFIARPGFIEDELAAVERAGRQSD